MSMASLPRPNAVFVLGTSVNVGKTICSLGILGGLRARLGKGARESGRVGYLKPVGGYGGADVVRTDTGEKMFGEDALQEGLQPGEESNQDVQLADKDAFLMREHFDMRADFNDMSPGEQAGVTGRADVDRLAC